MEIFKIDHLTWSIETKLNYASYVTQNCMILIFEEKVKILLESILQRIAFYYIFVYTIFKCQWFLV